MVLHRNNDVTTTQFARWTGLSRNTIEKNRNADAIDPQGIAFSPHRLDAG